MNESHVNELRTKVEKVKIEHRGIPKSEQVCYLGSIINKYRDVGDDTESVNVN